MSLQTQIHQTEAKLRNSRRLLWLRIRLLLAVTLSLFRLMADKTCIILRTMLFVWSFLLIFYCLGRTGRLLLRLTGRRGLLCLLRVLRPRRRWPLPTTHLHAQHVKHHTVLLQIVVSNMWHACISDTNLLSPSRCRKAPRQPDGVICQQHVTICIAVPHSCRLLTTIM